MSDDSMDPNNYWVQQANARAMRAEENERAARAELERERFANRSNLDLIVQLRDRIAALSQGASAQEVEARVQAGVAQALDALLSLPLREIAERNAGFRETFEAEQLVLAKWILSQKAYAESAVQLGVAAGMTQDDVNAVYKDNIVSVLANCTKYGNDAVGNPVLKANADRIIKSPRS